MADSIVDMYDHVQWYCGDLIKSGEGDNVHKKMVSHGAEKMYKYAAFLEFRYEWLYMHDRKMTGKVNTLSQENRRLKEKIKELEGETKC